MTRLESNKVIVSQTPLQAFEFLSDFENIGKLMPEQVTGFTTDGETCSFTIKGMATLGLIYESKDPVKSVVMKSHGKVPFDFKLICSLEDRGAETELTLFLDADLNPFLKMMAEKPLTNFLNLLANNYKSLASA
jgi:carbon monoxide dehydrogenase subunit G